MITDLETIARLATEWADDYDAFRYYVEDDERTDAELDALVDELAKPIIEAIDCTQCANCCRRLDVYLTPEDAAQLATGLSIPVQDVRTQYIDAAVNEGEWGVFRARPCAFLHGNLCSIYPHRPESCRAYPEFTPDFRWQLNHILGGVGLCPIIFNVVEQVKAGLIW